MSQNWSYCGHCSGLITQPGINYGWSGPVCHCALFIRAPKPDELTQLREERDSLQNRVTMYFVNIQELEKERDRLAADVDSRDKSLALFAGKYSEKKMRIRELSAQLDAARVEAFRMAEELKWIANGPTFGPGAPSIGRQLTMSIEHAREALRACPNAAELLESVWGMEKELETHETHRDTPCTICRALECFRSAWGA